MGLGRGERGEGVDKGELRGEFKEHKLSKGWNVFIHEGGNTG